MIRITIEIDDKTGGIEVRTPEKEIRNYPHPSEPKLTDILDEIKNVNIISIAGKPITPENEKKFVKEVDKELEKKPEKVVIHVHEKKNNRMPKFKKICEVCDNQFQPMSGRQIYCSDECKKIGKKIKTTETEISKQKKSTPHIIEHDTSETQKEYNKRAKKEESNQLKKCCICGTRFKPKTGNEECCSEKCDEENIKKQIAQGKKYDDQYFKNKPNDNE